MEISYQLHIHKLQDCGGGQHKLILHTADNELAMRIRFTPAEAEALIAEVSGRQSLRARMGATLLLLIEQVNARLRAIRLSRSMTNELEAALVLALPDDELLLPANPSDALSLALAQRLAIEGEASLAPWLHPRRGHESTSSLAAPIEEFLSSLPDFPA